MDISGNICTLYRFTTSKLFINRLYGSCNRLNVSALAVDGVINIAKIKTAGSGGANGIHTGVAIRGDGSSGVASVE